MKKKNYPLLAMILLGGFAIDAIAQSAGTLTCAAWISGRSQGENQALQVQNWLDGYLSGLADGSGYGVANAIGQPATYLWMDNYCRDHPRDNAKDAGAVLISEQLKKKRPYMHQY